MGVDDVAVGVALGVLSQPFLGEGLCRTGAHEEVGGGEAPAAGDGGRERGQRGMGLMAAANSAESGASARGRALAGCGGAGRTGRGEARWVDGRGCGVGGGWLVG